MPDQICSDIPEPSSCQSSEISSTGPLHELPLGDFLLKNGRPSLKLNFKGIYMSCKGRNDPILKDVSGYAEPGKLIAIMGPSGSGKTTLLNALSGRASVDRGEITLNGEVLNKSHKRQMAYVLQSDLFLPNVTLRETLMFHAEMGLPSNMTYRQKVTYMEKLASQFKLDDPNLFNTEFGHIKKRGLSGGEIKRANIVCEMLSNPSVLFLDEPTTGLDSHNACNVVENLVNVANGNRTVVMTIHQPSYKIFQMIDMLLLLCDGEVAYFGKREDVILTLGKLNITVADHCNIADALLDLCFIKVQRDALVEYTRTNIFGYGEPIIDKGSINTADNVKLIEDQSEEEVLNEVMVVNKNGKMQNGKHLELNVYLENGKATSKLLREEDKSGSDSSDSNLDGNSNVNKWPTTFCTQVRILTRRNFQDGFKKFVGDLRWANTFVLSLAFGAVWFLTPRIEEELNAINGYLFFMAAIFLLINAFETIVRFFEERVVIDKERASGMYRLSSYYCAKMISDLPLVMLLPMCFYTLSRLVTGGLTVTVFFGEGGILLVNVFVSQSVGYLIGTTIHIPSDMQRGVVACSLYSLPSILFGGFFVSHIPIWLSTLQKLSPVYHAYRALQIVEFYYGESITCARKNSHFEICHTDNGSFIPPYDLCDAGKDPLVPLLLHIFVLFLFGTVFRLLGYLILRFYKSPTKTR